MATEVESLVLRMSADLRRFEKSMTSMRTAADKRLTEVERRAAQADRTLSRTMSRAGENMTSALRNSLAGVSGTIAAAFSVDAIVGMADAFTQMQNRLKVTGLEAGALKQQFEALNTVADASRSPIEAVVATYSRLRLATEGMGFSNEQVTRTTEILSKALKASGATAGETSAALLQFGQAIGSGTLQGDELRSIRENAPAVARAIAAEFNTTVGALKNLGEEGKLTSERVMKAVLASGGAIDATFAKTEATVGDALTNLQNKLTSYIGLTDDSTSATDRMRQAINALADNLDTVALVVGAVATLMGGRFVLSMTAGSGAMIANGIATVRLAAFQTAMTASLTGQTTATIVATGAMARFNAMIAANPVGAAIIAVAALAAGLVYLNNRFGESAQAARVLDAAVTASDKALDEYEKAAKAAANATAANREEMNLAAAAALNEARARVTDTKAIYAQTAALAKQRAAAAQAADAAASGPLAGLSGPSYSPGLNAGTSDLASRRANAAAAAAKAEADAAEARLNQIIADARSGAFVDTPRVPPADDEKKRRAASGPTPEELARQRELLNLQSEIELLRAQGRGPEADARQDALDVLNLTKQYEEAGFANAKAKAETQVAALATARRAAAAAEEAKKQVEGEAQAADLTRGFVLEMLGVQEALALTERDSLAVRREILAIRQEERRLALEAAAADAEATEAERNAARDALVQLPNLERGEVRELEGSSNGARDAQGIVADLNFYETMVERAAEAYAEIDRLRQEDLISEQEAALAKSQIDSNLREARLSGTRTMLDTLASLQNSSNKKLAALGKAAAIAQATIDGVLAVQKALASAPPPFNFIQAAIVGAVAAANVASIAGMADGGIVRGRGGPRDDKELRRLSPGEFVVNARSTAQNRELLEQMNSGRRIPGLANGGMVGRAAAAAASVSSAGGRPTSSTLVFAPQVDARGADLAAVNRLERVLDEQARNFAANVNSVRDQRNKYRIGGRR